MERNDKDLRRDYNDSGDSGSPTGEGRNQPFFQPQATDSVDPDLPPVMEGASRRRSSSELQYDIVGFEQPGPQMQSQESRVRHGVQVLPVAPPRGLSASIAAGQQQGQMRNAVPLDSSSTSGIDSASGSERRCMKIEINPSTVQVHTSVMLWLAFTDGSGLPPRTTEVIIGFYSSRDPVHRTFVRGSMGPNSLLVKVKNPVWTEPDNVTVEVRTAIEPDGRVLGVGNLQFVRPPLTTPQLVSLLADPSTESIAEWMHDLVQSAREGSREGSAEGSKCQRCCNIPSRNVSTPYFICRPDDIAVKEAYTILIDQLEQSNASQERVDKLDESSEPTPKEDGTTVCNSQEPDGPYEVVSIVPFHEGMPPSPTISLPDDTGLTVPRSINFDPEVLTTLLQQVASNKITAMKAIEEMRTIVYHDPSNLLVQTTSNSQNNRRSARQNTRQRRHEDNRSPTASEVSDYTPDKRLPPKVERKKARPHSSVPSSYGPKSSIDTSRVDQSSLEDSDGQLTESNECPENHEHKQFAPSDSGFDEKCVEKLH